MDARRWTILLVVVLVSHSDPHLTPPYFLCLNKAPCFPQQGVFNLLRTQGVCAKIRLTY